MNTFYPFQLEGIDFLTTPTVAGKPHKLLADAPGIGKTVQACGAMRKLGAKSALIICPSVNAIKTSWRRHLIEWGVCTADDVVILQTGKDAVPTEPKFLIVGLELLDNDNLFRTLAWGKYDFIIIDEIHRLKSTHGKRTRRILGGGEMSLSSRGYWKIGLSGTPMPNRIIEMWALLATWAPEAIDPHRSYQDFGRHFCNGFWDGEWNFKGASNTDELRQRLRDSGFYLRREVREVFPDMPELVDRTVYVDIGTMIEDETNTPIATLRKLIGVQKIPHVVEYVKYKLEEAPKILVFTYHREVSEGLYEALKTESARLIYGGMGNGFKDAALRDFIEGNARVLIAQRDSVGTGTDGIQLATNYIIEAEPDWSAGGYEQEYSRVWRHGQNETVYLDSVIAEGGLDETVYANRNRKDGLLDRVVRNHLPQREEECMSLEDVIRENTAAVQALTAALQSAGIANGSTQTAPATEAPKGKGKGKAASTNGQSAAQEEKAASGSVSTAAAADPKSAAKSAASSPNTAASTVTWEQVQEAASKALEVQSELVGEEEAVVKARYVVESCGVQRLDELKRSPDVWDLALERFNALAEKAAAKTGLASL